MRLGAHCSTAGGVYKALLRARDCGCQVLQIFTKNSNQWQGKPLKKEELERFRQNVKETGVEPAMAHASYLINLCAEGKNQKASKKAMLDEIERCEALGIKFLVLHPGAALQLPRKQALKSAAKLLSHVLKETAGYRTKILLENTAGQGTCVGHRLEELAFLLEETKDFEERLGICMDTCHAFAAGYPIHTEKGYEEFFDELKRKLGFEKLCALHLNDSRKEFCSRVDRHAVIGEGKMGLWVFWKLLRDSRLKGKASVLETPPKDGLELHESYALQLKRLRLMMKQDTPPEPPFSGSLF